MIKDMLCRKFWLTSLRLLFGKNVQLTHISQQDLMQGNKGLFTLIWLNPILSRNVWLQSQLPFLFQFLSHVILQLPNDSPKLPN